jgi:hypothetical protein
MHRTSALICLRLLLPAAFAALALAISSRPATAWYDPATDDGYQVLYGWTDTSGARHLTGVSQQDDGCEEVVLGEYRGVDDSFQQFRFPFYGRDFTEIAIHSNGYVTLGATCHQDQCPTHGENRELWQEGHDIGTCAPTIAPWWDDWDPQRSGDIYVSGLKQFESDRGEFYKVITWQEMAPAGLRDTGERYSFQLRLYASGRIEFHYQKATGEGPDAPPAPHAAGRSGSVGFQEHAETVGHGYCFEDGKGDHTPDCKLENLTAIGFRRPHSAVYLKLSDYVYRKPRAKVPIVFQSSEYIKASPAWVNYPTYLDSQGKWVPYATGEDGWVRFVPSDKRTFNKLGYFIKNTEIYSDGGFPFGNGDWIVAPDEREEYLDADVGEVSHIDPDYRREDVLGAGIFLFEKRIDLTPRASELRILEDFIGYGRGDECTGDLGCQCGARPDHQAHCKCARLEGGVKYCTEQYQSKLAFWNSGDAYDRVLLIVPGFDALNEDTSADLMAKYLPILLELMTRGYDVAIGDYGDGNQFLDTLEYEVGNWISWASYQQEMATAAGSGVVDKRIVLTGVSQGGAVVMHTLAGSIAALDRVKVWVTAAGANAGAHLGAARKGAQTLVMCHFCKEDPIGSTQPTCRAIFSRPAEVLKDWTVMFPGSGEPPHDYWNGGTHACVCPKLPHEWECKYWDRGRWEDYFRPDGGEGGYEWPRNFDSQGNPVYRYAATHGDATENVGEDYFRQKPGGGALWDFKYSGDCACGVPDQRSWDPHVRDCLAGETYISPFKVSQGEKCVGEVSLKWPFGYMLIHQTLLADYTIDASDDDPNQLDGKCSNTYQSFEVPTVDPQSLDPANPADVEKPGWYKWFANDSNWPHCIISEHLACNFEEYVRWHVEGRTPRPEDCEPPPSSLDPYLADWKCLEIPTE